MSIKNHLVDGDILTWYNDPSIKATWHSNGRLDIFDRTNVSICDANFRIIKGHWKTSDEHGVGTFPSKWVYDGITIDAYMELFPGFWKSTELKVPKVRQSRKSRQQSSEPVQTTKVVKKTKKDVPSTINIKSEPVKTHIGSQKWTNDDWSTIVFIIDRREIYQRFVDKELRYNGIYFLVDYDHCYVGQALKRADGESFLARFREHDKNTAEKYHDQWLWAIAITNKDDAWGSSEVDALESIFINEVPDEYNVNGRKQNSGGADISAYEDKVKQIKSLVTAMGFEFFSTQFVTENIQITSVANDYSPVEDLQNGMTRIPEIVTPQRVVKQMVDMLPVEVWNDQTVFFDPACKGGEYLREIYDRLMDNEIMQSKYPDAFDRSNHILFKQIYGIALSQVSKDRTVKKLHGFENNIKIIPDYIEILKALLKDSKELQEKDQIKPIDIMRKVYNNKDMKFDIVIGNPPYQKDSERGTQGAVSLYTLFMELGNKIGTITSMIVPARWVCNAGSRGIDNEWVTKELKSNKYVSMHIEEDSKKIFKGVDIKGGVMYYVRDNKYNGTCDVNGEHRYLDDAGIGKFVYNYIESEIIRKIRKASNKYMNSVVSSYSPFGMQSNVVCKTTGNIKLHRTRGAVEYISIDDIPKGHNLLNKYKVFVPLSYGDGRKGEILTNIKVVGPNEACTSTYVAVFPTDNIDVANNVAKYLSTRLFNLLIGEVKVTQSASKEVYQLVPLQDFTSTSDIDWSQSISNIDQQLYKKYNLNQEEIDYIEKTIRPME